MQGKQGRLLRIGYLVVLLIGVFPLLPGLAGMLSPAFGIIPPLGLYQFSWQGFSAVFNWPSVTTSLLLSITSAVISCFLACMAAFSLLQAYWNKPAWQWLEKLLSPLLALPHVAFAVGFLFLFSDSGWIARLAYALLPNSSYEVLFALQDNLGLGLTLALAIKETPFLLIMSIAVLNNLNMTKTLQVAQSLGYSYSQAWWKVIFPQWLVHMRFPLFAIMAYSASVVDVSLIIGPTHPPTFAVLVWQWFNEPDLSLLTRAAAGAMVLFILCSLLIGLVWFVEKLSTHCLRGWLISGSKSYIKPTHSKLPHSELSHSKPNTVKTHFAFSLGTALIAVSMVTLPILLIWTFALRWPFPDILPALWSSRFWVSEWPYIQQTIITSMMLALISSLVALVLAIIAQEYRQQYRLSVPMYVIALPMLIPQLSLLFGLQVTSLWINQEHYWLWVIWSHVFFAFPYAYLSLDGPWKSYPYRLSQTAISLGASPIKTFIQIKLRTLAGGILFAWAMAMSVSLAQYLPTLMLGSGRVITLTTEAVALSSGQDRRIVALYALWQAVLPLMIFSLAFWGNRLLNTSPSAQRSIKRSIKGN